MGDRFKAREIANDIREESAGYDVNIADVLELEKKQSDYE